MGFPKENAGWALRGTSLASIGALLVWGWNLIRGVVAPGLGPLVRWVALRGVEKGLPKTGTCCPLVRNSITDSTFISHICLSVHAPGLLSGSALPPPAQCPVTRGPWGRRPMPPPATTTLCPPEPPAPSHPPPAGNPPWKPLPDMGVHYWRSSAFVAVLAWLGPNEEGTHFCGHTSPGGWEQEDLSSNPGPSFPICKMGCWTNPGHLVKPEFWEASARERPVVTRTDKGTWFSVG